MAAGGGLQAGALNVDAGEFMDRIYHLELDSAKAVGMESIDKQNG